MTNKIDLANRLREVLLNGKWIANTNYKEQLLSISWEQAVQKVENLNTIAALTFHINYYLDGLLRALESGIDQTAKTAGTNSDWDKLVVTFLHNAEKFADKVEQMEDSIFNQPFFDEKYGTYQRNIEGVIEHCYYHLGQISLIRKMVLNGKGT